MSSLLTKAHYQLVFSLYVCNVRLSLSASCNQIQCVIGRRSANSDELLFCFVFGELIELLSEAVRKFKVGDTLTTGQKA